MSFGVSNAGQGQPLPRIPGVRWRWGHRGLRTLVAVGVWTAVWLGSLRLLATESADGPASSSETCAACRETAAAGGSAQGATTDRSLTGRDKSPGGGFHQQAAGLSPLWLSWILDTSRYPPRWRCGHWTPWMGWLHIVSDIAIFGAYLTIPLALTWFVLRRHDTPFSPLFWLFAAFILCCGVGHLLEAIIFWTPIYGLAGLLKMVTAIVSWTTALVLMPLLPRAIAFPTLAEANARLEREVRQREESERRLAEQKARLQQSLEELERFTTQVVDREDRVIELKQQVNQLRAELGREPAFLQEASL